MEKQTDIQTTREANLSNLLRWCVYALGVGGVGAAVFYLFGFTIRHSVLPYTAYYYLLYASFLSCVFLIIPTRKKDKGVRWYDLVLAALTFVISFYFVLHTDEIVGVGWRPASPFNFALALIFVLLILEGARRAAGFIYLFVCIAIGLYPLFAGHMPGMFYGVSFPFIDIISFVVFGTGGLLGLPAQVMGQYLIGFLIFAAVLIASGAAEFFMNLSLALLGRFRGGPAKVAVLASALFGSLSGSAVSNVVATGSITIPTMKRTGYAPDDAGAIEACASTGGIFMPPVMGAVAFVMCWFLDMPYAAVISCAAIPAILYYFGLLVQVDAYAAKHELRGLAREQIPSLITTLKNGWPFISVLVFLVWGLLYMGWEEVSPFYATGLMIILSFFRRETMLSLKKIRNTIILIVRFLTHTMAVIAPIGIIVCGLSITGVASSLTSGLIYLGGENSVLVVVIGVVICYILGMAGMMVPAYIFLAVTMAPAVIQLTGLSPVSVHLFIVYYAMLAGITFPVAPVSFVAAAISQASPMRTALQSMRYGIVIYFIPFFFLIEPSLILLGTIPETLYFFALCLVGITFIGAGLGGYLVGVGKVGLLARSLLVIAGFLIALPEWKTTIFGAALAVCVIAVTLIRRKAKVEALARIEREE